MVGSGILHRDGPINVGTAERIGTSIAGAALILRAIAHPTMGRVLLGIGGAALLQRGLSGHCPLYAALGIGASKTPDRIETREEDPVTCTSEDSFPASDPPSWTPIAGTLSRH